MPMNLQFNLQRTKSFVAILIAALATTIVTSCSTDSDTLWFEQSQMLKLNLKSNSFNYKVEGNEVNEIGYFYSKRKIEGYSKMLICGVNSSWDHAPIKFKVKITYRGNDELVTKELIKEGIYSSETTEGQLQINFEFVDENGVLWNTYPNPASKNLPKSIIEVTSIETRYSPLNGSKKDKLNMNFESTFYNDQNEKLDIDGSITAVVEPRF